MRDYALDGIAMIRGRSGADLENEVMLRLALERVVTVVGEAAARLSTEFRESHPEVPWPLMIGMRNRLVHGYDDVALATLWETASQSLPALVSQLDAILGDGGNG